MRPYKHADEQQNRKETAVNGDYAYQLQSCLTTYPFQQLRQYQPDQNDHHHECNIEFLADSRGTYVHGFNGIDALPLVLRTEQNELRVKLDCQNVIAKAGKLESIIRARKHFLMQVSESRQ
eukprot:466983_1